MKKIIISLVLVISLFLNMVDLGQLLANTGQWLGAPEMGWSEALKGTSAQTKPSSTYTTGLLGGGGLQISPISGQYDVKTNQWENTFRPPAINPVWQQQQQQQQQRQRQDNPSSQNNRQGGTITENEALARGWDINNLPAGYTRASSGNGIHTPNYDALISQINQNADVALAGLDPQRVAQEAIAQNMYTGGVSDLQAQQAQGNAALDITRRKAQENQVSTLNDLTENLRNMFSAGQTYLGSRGAGDSSAANQYGYALTQLGNKNRGNVMNQTASIMNDINDRANQLQMQVTQGIKQLDSERGNALQGIAQWFAQAQAQIRATKGQNIVALGQRALDNAMNAINQVNANAQAQKNNLLQWAENNATTIMGLKNNMQQIFGNYNPQLPVAGNLPGLIGGAVGSNGNYYPGNNQTDQLLDIFGNPKQ